MQNRFGLLPKLYCEKKKLYCKAGLYCSLGKKLYCDNRFCIAMIKIVLQLRRLGWAGSVLQYTGLYYREEELYCMIVLKEDGWGKFVSQYNRLYCD